MKTSLILCFAALMLAIAPASSSADYAKKKTVQTQVATANQQISIRHLRIRAAVLVINQ